MTRTALGQYQLTIPGQSPTTGMLILTVANEISNASTTAPDDNILTYATGSGSSFTINSFDLPDLGSASSNFSDTKFVWAFISFANPVSPYFLPGDYNHDWLVDNADYATWRSQYGQSSGYMTADGNGDGRVDTADYVLWRKYRSASGSGAIEGGAVPEPATFSLCFSLCLLMGWRRRRGVEGA